MALINEEKILELAALSVEEKTAQARCDYDSIIQSMESKGTQTAQEVRESIDILAATVVFGNYAFSQTERDFLENTIDLKKDDAYKLQHECEEYFYDAATVFRTNLSEQEREKVAEIMVLLATVDGHISKKELRWLRKILHVI